VGLDPTIKIILSADWHLGHKRVKTEDTANDIANSLFPRIPTADMLCIAGDIFDGRVSFNSGDTSVIIGLFVDMLKLCYGNNVTVRIIRGTYSHDILQNNVLTKIYSKLGLPIDFKVINDLSVEYNEKLKLSFLYIPDNLPYKGKNDLLRVATDIMKANDLKMVDYVVMHGEFDVMGYNDFGRNIFTLNDFNKICRYLVLSGHIHKPIHTGKLVYAGSINRLSHNEEEPKGFWEIVGDQPTFIENPNATKFITLDYTGVTSLKEAMERYSNDIAIFNERAAFLRIVVNDIHIRQSLLIHHNSIYPHIKLTFKSQKRYEQTDKYLDDKIKSKQEQREIPTRANISAIVSNYIETSYGIYMKLDDIEAIIN
jgi:DNA repair exonuclease SbcCD nuclease subunit